VLIIFSFADWIAVLGIPLVPPLKKGEERVLPFYKGESEEIFLKVLAQLE